MTLDDVEVVHGLGSSLKEFSTQSGSFWSQEQLACWCTSSNDVTLVAENNGTVVGFSLYAVHTPTKKVTWENLYVDPAGRGLGVGSALIHEGHKRLKEKGYTYVALQNNNEDQEKFAQYLERFGFKKGDSVLWMDQFL